MDKALAVLGLVVQVFSDVIDGGLDEDGQRIELLAFYVVVEDADGNRWRSVAQWVKQSAWDEEAEAQASAHAERVSEFLLKGAHPARSIKWYRHRPMYGSKAYFEYGQAEDVRWEKEAN